MELHLPEHVDVVVVLGSKSDRELAAQMTGVFASFGVAASFHVCSAHRDHERLAELVPAAEARGARVFIGVAGMAAHLPGVLAALTVRPVIGVPGAGSMKGLDALLAIAQMPPGIPVACVAVGGGMNAALLAVEILAAGDAGLRAKLEEYRANMRVKNRDDDEALRAGLGV
jgi:5-(carboxyamino)imidazole ribonucleotide mutase